ncbi:MAG: hypothetical protein JWO95_2372 [Verrucomicrobiales bacterium]|nr:hypothetical protein [Verrucomicrobiales bacterium]
MYKLRHRTRTSSEKSSAVQKRVRFTKMMTRGERIGLTIALVAVLAYGALLEQRTALRRVPMTDLTVPPCAAWALLHGDNIYKVTDCHNWHYGYPPAVAIFFIPFAEQPPTPPAVLPKGELRTEANTPWGYEIASRKKLYGLHADNLHFFCIVAVWYFINLFLIAFSAHALACAVERTELRAPRPTDPKQRRHWWLLRTIPLLICAGSLVTDLSRGQVDVLMLAAIAAGLYFASRRREFTAGWLLAIPAVIKLFPVLLLGLPFWRRRWKMLLGSIASLLFLFLLLPALVMGPSRTIENYQTWFEVIIKPGLGAGTDTSRAHELTAMNATDNQSLLAFFHNWQYHEIKRDQRPAKAGSGARVAVYVTGCLMLLGFCFVAGKSGGDDSPQHILLLAGILIGTALLINPVVHNYYYLLLLPLLTSLVHHRLTNAAPSSPLTSVSTLLITFTLIDILTRMPNIGPWLRDVGAPLLSVVALLITAAAIRIREQPVSTKSFALKTA